jgi:hypothetical protein
LKWVGDGDEVELRLMVRGERETRKLMRIDDFSFISYQ